MCNCDPYETGCHHVSCPELAKTAAMWKRLHNEQGGACGCEATDLWYDNKLGIWRCRNCGWCC